MQAEDEELESRVRQRINSNGEIGILGKVIDDEIGIPATVEHMLTHTPSLQLVPTLYWRKRPHI